MTPIIPHWSRYISNKLGYSEIKWPSIDLQESYSDSKMRWIYYYCDILQRKFSKKIKRIKGLETKFCKIKINNNWSDELKHILNTDISDKDSRTKLLEQYNNKQNIIELFHPLENFSRQIYQRINC